MSFVDWRIKGPELTNCNCAYGCPCQFNALPTYGDCRAYTAMQIDEGHFGDVNLDGLRWAMFFDWPQAVHQGNGTCQAVIDEGASDAQREALGKILHGEETEPGATVLQVFSTTMTKTLKTLYRPIEFYADVEERMGTVNIPGILTARAEPIKNPVTGNAHRARINLPNGFEYTQAEIASGTAKATGEIKLDFDKTHSHFTILHMTQNGVVR